MLFQGNDYSGVMPWPGLLIWPLLHDVGIMTKKSAQKTYPIHPESGQEITPENKCSFCSGSLCCSYITHEIDSPRSKHDFDYLLWQISHENIQVYKDDEGWYLIVNNRCTHLLPGGGCGIYEVRPQICRDHTNDYCEYDSPAEDGFELYFRNYDELNSYCRKRFKTWDQRF